MTVDMTLFECHSNLSDVMEKLYGSTQIIIMNIIIFYHFLLGLDVCASHADTGYVNNVDDVSPQPHSSLHSGTMRSLKRGDQTL